ncbi:MAG: hypothetical protein ABW042_07265 [Phenylobacterium sp.]
MIGVMVEVAGETAPLRHFFAVSDEDQARAEWRAIDRAAEAGRVATSPVGGLEPVHVVSRLSPTTVASQALKPGEVRPLGWKWPRRWITS